MSDSDTTPVLATLQQLDAEEKLIVLAADPDILAVAARLRADIVSTAPFARTAEGAATLGHALTLWTNALILRVLAGDPEHPTLLWSIDNTPHRWFGKDVPASGATGDNPDFIYRNSFLDGEGLYEIQGKVDIAHRPVQFTFETTRGSPSFFAPAAPRKNSSDIGNHLDMIIDDRMVISSDGSFAVTIGPERQGPNHLRTEAGPVTLIVRDVISDWTQNANRLALHRLDRPFGTRRALADVKRHVLADLPDFLRYWSQFTLNWFSGAALNTVIGPVRRDGGWGHAAIVRFRFEPGEAAVVTTSRGDARYTGMQVTGPWGPAVDGAKHITSLNDSQVAADTDGRTTYVVSPADPGIANWLDTGGLHEGFVMMRWHGLPEGRPAEELVHEFAIMKLSAIRAGALNAAAKVSASARKAQKEKRERLYRLRTETR